MVSHFMYFYSVGYCSYEDSDYIALVHQEKYSDDEFFDVIYSTLPFVVEKLKKDLLIEEYEYDWFYDKLDKMLNISFRCLYKIIAEVLVEKFGFEKVEYQSELILFGWPNIMQEKDWDYDNHKYNKIVELIRKELKDAPINSNWTIGNY